MAHHSPCCSLPSVNRDGTRKSNTTMSTPTTSGRRRPRHPRLWPCFRLRSPHPVPNLEGGPLRQDATGPWPGKSGAPAEVASRGGRQNQPPAVPPNRLASLAGMKTGCSKPVSVHPQAKAWCHAGPPGHVHHHPKWPTSQDNDEASPARQPQPAVADDWIRPIQIGTIKRHRRHVRPPCEELCASAPHR